MYGGLYGLLMSCIKVLMETSIRAAINGCCKGSYEGSAAVTIKGY